MSGDVQPRKRKDKKKKKDELGLEEPRGTAAALGDGDVFIHSQHEHGTGGHWCAKIIFFSLLAVLITLIGLIILENRGLTELEANSVESKYSGVLEGWIEDAPEDDHYDEHTLDLKHPEDNDEDHPVHKSDHDEDDEDHESQNEHDEEEEDDEHEEDEDDKNESNEIDSNKDDNDEVSEENIGETEEVEERVPYRRYNYKEKYNTYDDDDDDDDDDDNDDDDDEDDNEDNEESEQLEENDLIDDENDINSDEQEDDDDVDDDDDIDNVEDSANYVAELENDEDENNDDEDNNEENHQADFDENDIEENVVQENIDDDEDDEIEKIEAENSDEVEKPVTSKEDVGDDDDVDNDNDAPQDEDDDDEPPVEQITTPPAGKPFTEIEEETTVKPIDTLAEEFEYERRQEELRKEKEEQGSQMWLKLAVGGALLVATHAVLRRATARDDPEPEDRSREETPSMADRRMTLIPDEPEVQQSSISSARPLADEEVFKKPAPVFKNEPIIKPNIVEEVKEKNFFAEENKPINKVQEYERDEEEKELYSDEEEIVEEEEEEEEIDEPPKVTPPQKTQPASKEDSDPEEVPDDVEIIDDEQIEEEVEEEDDDEEEISDVDDTELLSRLEAKYGRLPEPERPGRKDGGNSIEDEWPGEPIEPYWREQLDIAEEELRQGALASCEERVSAPNLADSGRAKWILARAIDASAEAKRDNKLLSKAISAYLNLLKINERLSDRKLLEVAQRTIDRIQFRGTYLNAEPIYRLLIRRFPQDVNYRNNLTVSFLMANRADLADEVLRETLTLWPNDRVALAHHGFVLKIQYNKLEEAVVALQKALEGDAGPANEPRFYYHLGDALLLLGRSEEAHQVHVRGAELGHFLSPAQRSLYNVPRLRSRPWWPVEETPYVKFARALEKSWREILKEAEAAKDLYEQEKEGLKDKGEWSQLDIFVRGRELPGRCARAPATCALVRAEAAARCRRGQVKFSALAAATHVRAHVGPTNCRLRLHLALSNAAHTYIRVDKEIRQWEVGKTFIFDDSFEHEVWHNGTGTRLVLIVDLWHPDLTPQERRTLPAI